MNLDLLLQAIVIDNDDEPIGIVSGVEIRNGRARIRVSLATDIEEYEEDPDQPEDEEPETIMEKIRAIGGQGE